MYLDEPRWWYGSKAALPARLLGPVAALWAMIADYRFSRVTPFRAAVPVICVGNFTAGGTGKTPLAMYVSDRLRALGFSPAFLTRGFGGKRAGPHLVDPERDTAADVGDEPLLLARAAPVIVARDRVAGARYIAAQLATAGAIIMDDGLQNPSLAKDLSIAVVDGRRGLGNGRVIPAGPLRARLESQLSRADAIIVNRRQSDLAAPCPIIAALRREFAGPVLTASTAPAADVAWLAGLRVHAFAGIGAPDRFFDMLRALGAEVRRTQGFRDHHPFSEAEARRLLDLAEADRATLVTTEKDWVRLGQGSPALRALRQTARAVGIAVCLADGDRDRLDAILLGALSSARRRAVQS